MPHSRYRWALTGLAGLVGGRCPGHRLAPQRPPHAATGSGNAALIPTDKRMEAAEFTGLDGWLNSQPLTLQGLRGKVVLVDFWTFSCVNCVRTIPTSNTSSRRTPAAAWSSSAALAGVRLREGGHNDVAAVQRMG